MRNMFVIAAFAVASISTPALAQTVTYNSNPVDGFHYGAGNDYLPANAVVLTSPNTELALRFHQTGIAAPASDAAGVYSFALGTTPISFDWSVDGNRENSLITLTSILTGQVISYNPFFIGNDNYNGGLADPDLYQNSARLNFGFLFGSNFNPNVNNTYRADLTAGGQTVTAFARLGAGAPAVPEPATWAMMLLGFGGIGFQLRRARKTATALTQAA